MLASRKLLSSSGPSYLKMSIIKGALKAGILQKKSGVLIEVSLGSNPVKPKYRELQNSLIRNKVMMEFAEYVLSEIHFL